MRKLIKSLQQSGITREDGLKKNDISQLLFRPNNFLRRQILPRKKHMRKDFKVRFYLNI